MTSITKVVRARRAVLPEGEAAVSIAIAGETIAAIGAYDEPYDCTDVTVLADDEVLLPGLIDAHVHVNEPGRTEWEGFASVTKAAAAGGITTLVDMPLNSKPATTSVANLELKREVAKDQLMMDVGFWGGAIPGNVDDLEPLWNEGVFGFKCFLGDSGLEEYPYLNQEELRAAMVEIATFGGLLIAHAEDAGTLDQAPHTNGRDFMAFMRSHPASAEDAAIATVIEAVRETGCRTHILHLASASALPLIKAAKAEGLPITVETCPHYLTFDAEEVPDGATQFKCCPPLRDHANRMELWRGLADGTIDFIASDHSPSTADLKSLDTGDFGTAWGGISSVQLGLPAVWTQARQLGHSLSDVVRWMGSNPADVVGIAGKGRLAIGARADLAIVAPDDEFIVDKEALFHKNKVSPYDGRTLTGVVRATWLAGEPIDLEGRRRGRELVRGRDLVQA
ncbi:allantoinase AllB [Raineyella fluvialis]|uniref:allantoinase AllB n=1 Tax=Raineyella fluvialis TaxID=2662261 RepID=UPI00188FAF8F|nr:allantoinase AllB [Raineyella fluvialis]